MKTQILCCCFFLFFFSKQIVSQTDPYPYRGLYVDKLVKWVDDEFPTIDESRTLLGRTTEEDSLLNFARDHNFKYLILYSLERVFSHPTAILPNSGGRTYEDALCDFINKAKTQYCIEHIGAVISSDRYLDSIADFNSLLITDPYDFNDPESTFQPDSPNPLSFVSQTYTPGDGHIALRSEMVKTALRINDFNSNCSSKINVITTEYEFWQKYRDQGCMMLDSIIYQDANTLVYNGNTISSPASFILDNNDTLTIPATFLVFDDDTIFPTDTLFFCRTNNQVWEYRQLLHDMNAAQAGATFPLILDTYLGWFDKDTIDDILQTAMIDSVVDRIGLHAYNANVSHLWGYYDNRDSLFGHNGVPNTLIHPIISSEGTALGGEPFLGPYLSNPLSNQTLYEAERIFMSGYFPNQAVWHGDNLPLQYGAFNWFAQSFFKLRVISGNRNYLSNILYNRPATTCAGASVNFNYIGPNESGITMVWNYGDGQKDSLVSPDTAQQNRSHVFAGAGTYIVRCTLYYPAPTDTGIYGCVPYVYKDTVFINGASITPVGSTTFCQGDSLRLNASTGSAYSWSTGSTASFIYVKNSGTYTVTVTNSNGCPSSTASITVIVQPNPSASINIVDQPCLGGGTQGALSVLASGGTPSYHYLWSTGGTSNGINNLSAGNYFITVTDSFGCIARDTIALTEDSTCCGVFTSTITQQDFDAMSSISGDYNINTNITLTQNVTLTNCTLAIAAGVMITVDSFDLIIDQGSQLYACNRMWRGIFVSGTGEIQVIGASSIEDAQYGIEATNGTTVYSNDATFRNNYIGIYFSQTGSFGPATLTATVTNSLFTSNALHQGYSGQIPAVLPNGRSWAGIHIKGNTFINIGVAGQPANIFTNMNSGIYSERASVTVRNSLFNSIQNYNSYTYPFAQARGAGIALRGSSTHALNQVGNNNILVNDFEDCETGIAIQGSTLNSVDNFIFNCNTGYFCNRANNCKLEIENNNLDCNVFGVQLLLNDNSSLVRVEDNTITVGLRSAINSTSPPHAIGIDIAEQNIKNTNRFIRENDIYMEGFADHGILANAITGYTIDHNNVLINDINTNITGISLVRSTESHVNCNSVSGNSQSYSNAQQSSMWFQDSPENTISCNAVSNATGGYTFFGGCIGGSGTIFRANDIGHHDIGLHYRGTATRVDAQSFQGNYWNEPNYTQFAALNEDTLFAGADFHKVDNTGPRFPGNTMTNLPDSLQISPPGIFIFEDIGTDEDCGERIHHGDCIIGEGGGGGGDGDARIAQNLEGSQDFDEETRWKLRERLYEKLLYEPHYLDSDTVFVNFFYSMAGSYLQQIASLNKGINEVYPNQSATLQTISTRTGDILYNATLLSIYDSILFANSNNQPVLDSIELKRADIIQNTNTLLQLNESSIDLVKQAVMNDADVLNAGNAVINSQKIYEQNEKAVNEAYLLGVVKEDYSELSSRYSSLTSIALQCPLSGGPAVYKARSLVRLLDPTIRYNDELTCLQTGYTWRKKKNDTKAFVVYPNPGNESINIQYSVSSNSVFAIYNHIGNLVMKTTLESESNQKTIDVSNLTSGIYHCTITSSDNIAGSMEKLIIVH